MDKDKLMQFAREIEIQGYNRGVLTILSEILKKMDEAGMKSISYKSIKEIYERYKKI